MEKHIFDESNGLSYTLHGDYYLPDLALPTEEKIYLGKYGRLHKDFLKNHRPVVFTNLLTSGRLNSHCKEIDETANDRIKIIIADMKKAEGVNEQLKATDQMAWVGAMNNIKNRAEEIILGELIYV